MNPTPVRARLTRAQTLIVYIAVVAATAATNFVIIGMSIALDHDSVAPEARPGLAPCTDPAGVPR